MVAKRQDAVDGRGLVADPMPARTPAADAAPARTPAGDAAPARTPAGDAGDAVPAYTPAGDAIPARTPAGEAVPARTPAGDAFSRFAFGVIRLGNLLGAAGDALARPAGQTSARWQVLAGAESGTMTVADIARMLGLARQSVQRVADMLEADGLVLTVDNPRHRRARLLTLTTAGREALTAIQAAQAHWANGLGKRLGTRDLRRASEVIKEAIAALSRR